MRGSVSDDPQENRLAMAISHYIKEIGRGKEGARPLRRSRRPT
jgi:hypothetical protein